MTELVELVEELVNTGLSPGKSSKHVATNIAVCRCLLNYYVSTVKQNRCFADGKTGKRWGNICPQLMFLGTRFLDLPGLYNRTNIEYFKFLVTCEYYLNLTQKNYLWILASNIGTAFICYLASTVLESRASSNFTVHVFARYMLIFLERSFVHSSVTQASLISN